MSNKIPDEHFKTICKPGQGPKTCCMIIAGAGGIECALGTDLEVLLRQRADLGQMHAQSINCEGPPTAVVVK